MNISMMKMKLRDLFGDSPRIKIIEFFLLHSGEQFSLTEISHKTKVSLGSAYVHCKDLEKKDFILKEQKGKSTYYQLRRKERMVKELKRFYNLNFGLLNLFLKKIPAETVQKIILFGSAARGEDHPDSDFDLLIIGKIPVSTAFLLANSLSAERKISLIVRSPEEYLSMPQREETLWKKIQSEGVIVYES